VEVDSVLNVKERQSRPHGFGRARKGVGSTATVTETLLHRVLTLKEGGKKQNHRGPTRDVLKILRIPAESKMSLEGEEKTQQNTGKKLHNKKGRMASGETRATGEG